MTKDPTPGGRPTFGGLILQHTIVFVICIVFPGAVTAIVPASWITFERQNATVTCVTRTCVWFIVPYKVQRVERVTEISSRATAGRTERKRKLGRTTDDTVNVDGEGFLQIHGPAGELAEVSVSPASLQDVVESSQTFLDGTEPVAYMTIFAIANWKFGAIMGGVLTCLTVLYVVGYSIGLLKFILVGLKRLVAPYSDTAPK